MNVANSKNSQQEFMAGAAPPGRRTMASVPVTPFVSQDRQIASPEAIQHDPIVVSLDET